MWLLRYKRVYVYLVFFFLIDVRVFKLVCDYVVYKDADVMT